MYDSYITFKKSKFVLSKRLRVDLKERVRKSNSQEVHGFGENWEIRVEMLVV